MIKEAISCDNPKGQEESALQAKTALLVKQSYIFSYSSLQEYPLYEYDFDVIKEVFLGFVNFEERKTSIFTVSYIKKEGLTVSFTFFRDEEKKLLKTCELSLKAVLSFREKDSDADSGKTLTKEFSLEDENPINFSYVFPASTTYLVKMKIECNELTTKWSDETEFITPEFDACCMWKKCPSNIYYLNEYSLEGDNKVATKAYLYVYIDDDRGYREDEQESGSCTIIGDIPIPLNKVTSWHIKILKSKNNNGENIFIGVAPFDINQNEDYNNCEKCGWYFNCYESTLCSGPPHDYQGLSKRYGPRKRKGGYVHTGDNIGVIMDTIKGELSFILNELNFGVAFEGIPLDEPLVPCVIIKYKGDSVELDLSKVKETMVDTSIPVPSGIERKSLTCDSINLSWNTVKGASFYQIEVDGINTGDASTVNTFTKNGFLPDTGHTFRIRVIKDNSVGEWSGIVKGRTQGVIAFRKCIWKGCPDDIDGRHKYFIDTHNPRIAST